MIGWLRLVPVVLLWACVWHRRSTLAYDAPNRALWVTLAGCATAATVDLPSVGRMIDRLSGLGPNTSALVKHSVVLVAATAAREVVRDLALSPQRVRLGGRRRFAGLGVAVVALVALFAAAPVHQVEQPSLTASYATSTVLLAYWAVFLVYLGVTLVGITRLTCWYERRIGPSPLRTTMRITGVGAVVGLLYVGHKAGYLALRRAGVHSGALVASLNGVEAVLLGVSMVLLVVGISWSTITEQPWARRSAAFWSYRMLERDWHNLTAAVPKAALGPAEGAAEPTRDIEKRLYDRVIEIRDARLTLRPYAPPHVVTYVIAAARRRRGPRRNLEALVEASWLELARRRKILGAAPAAALVEETPGAGDLSGETRWLVMVARQRRRAARIANQLASVVERENQEVG